MRYGIKRRGIKTKKMKEKMEFWVKVGGVVSSTV
jgi:hypothetical protein